MLAFFVLFMYNLSSIGYERVLSVGKRILLVDDEPLILKGLKYTLEQEGYETESATDGEEALAKFDNSTFDLILLDVMLPKLDGIAVCQRIREHSDVPIIMLTAKGEDMDKILGLEYGADDYMTKPFNILEVKARIKTILRRVTGNIQQQEHRVIRVHDMEVNLIKRSVTLGGRDVKLTAKEFDLLQMFVTNRGTVFSREQMLETVWKYDYAGGSWLLFHGSGLNRHSGPASGGRSCWPFLSLLACLFLLPRQR